MTSDQPHPQPPQDQDNATPSKQEKKKTATTVQITDSDLAKVQNLVLNAVYHGTPGLAWHLWKQSLPTFVGGANDNEEYDLLAPLWVHPWQRALGVGLSVFVALRLGQSAWGRHFHATYLVNPQQRAAQILQQHAERTKSPPAPPSTADASSSSWHSSWPISLPPVVWDVLLCAMVGLSTGFYSASQQTVYPSLALAPLLPGASHTNGVHQHLCPHMHKSLELIRQQQLALRTNNKGSGNNQVAHVDLSNPRHVRLLQSVDKTGLISLAHVLEYNCRARTRFGELFDSKVVPFPGLKGRSWPAPPPTPESTSSSSSSMFSFLWK